MEGYIRIGGALLTGVAIIAGAFLMSNREVNQSPTSNGIAVAHSNVRTTLDAVDSDGDGVEDWREELENKVFETLDSPEIVRDPDAEYFPPTTLTGQFSVAFFEKYFVAKTAGSFGQSKEQFVEQSVAELMRTTTLDYYTLQDIVVAEGRNADNIREYADRVAELIILNSLSEPIEVAIFQDAVATQDQSLLEDLTPMIEENQNIIDGLASAPVPRAMMQQHLALVNAYLEINAGLNAMQAAFADPLLTLTQIQLFESGVTKRITALQNIKNSLETRNIFYTEEEAGQFFYLF